MFVSKKRFNKIVEQNNNNLKKLDRVREIVFENKNLKKKITELNKSVDELNCELLKLRKIKKGN